MASPVAQPDASDYFALARPVPLLTSSQSHRANAPSFSSLSSDVTLADSLTPIVDFNHSTDTLVGLADTSPKSRRNVLSLRLALSQRSVPSARGLGLDSFSRIDEELPGLLRSAPDLRFPFRRLSSTLGFPFDDAAGLSLQPPPPRMLRKQTTLPNLLSLPTTLQFDHSKRSLYVAPTQNMRSAILNLSPATKYLLPAEIAALLETCYTDPRTNLPSVFVVDIRSFADYGKCNVAGSVNVCPPLTLLRRPAFTLAKCVASLPNYERLVFLNYLHLNKANEQLNTVFNSATMGLHGLPPIFIYDNVNTSPNLYHMCKKLVDLSCWDVISTPPIYLLDGCFADFAAQYGHLVSAGKSESIDLSKLAVKSVAETPLAGVADLTMHPLDTKRAPRARFVSAPSLPSFTLDTSTPNVSNFSLPQNLPQKAFKIRHNEEVMDLSASPMETPLAKLSDAELGALPVWLKEAMSHPNGIKENFQKLEMCEKLRLNNALSLESKPELVTPGGHMETSPVINCGLDYGHKNRYKDIFLYDHSRVKLQKRGSISDQGECDYINASYLKPTAEFMDLARSESKGHLMRDLKIIATQGPLQETTGDFWKCIVNENCLLIVSLTEEYEGGSHKCSAYWKPGVYKSGRSLVHVELRKEESLDPFVLRSFIITVDRTVRRVLQIQLNNWADMSTSVDPCDILAIVALKNYILSATVPEPGYSTITHCSAGCGRTGVFCTVDAVVSLMRVNNNHCELPHDPVYELVNNLRRQRILMVQTMRQYCLVYDVLVQYALGNRVKAVCKLAIVQEFLESIRK